MSRRCENCSTPEKTVDMKVRLEESNDKITVYQCENCGNKVKEDKESGKALLNG